MSDKKIQKADLQYWRGLDGMNEGARPEEILRREFPEGMLESADIISRRNFLTLVGASIALAGLAGCRRPVEKIIPYVTQPEEIVPGIPQYYATTMPFGASAYGLLVESHEGRPTKIEGNVSHPSTRGRSNALMQAEILSLYDPDRSAAVLHNGAVSDWDSFVADWQDRFAAFLNSGGEGLALLIEPFSSPTLARLQVAFVERFPRADFVSYAPISDESIFIGVAEIDQKHRFLRPDYRLDLARVILSLDADILLTESENVVNAGRLIDGRRLTDENSPMNRLYVVEPDYTITGAAADHRLALSRSKLPAFAMALASALALLGVNTGLNITGAHSANDVFDRTWLDTVAGDLVENRGKSLIVAGRSQPPMVHALVAALNAALGNIGNTVVFRETPDTALSSFQGLAQLTEKMRAGKINALVMAGGNPGYGAAGGIGFEDALKNVPLTICLGRYVDETSRHSVWHLPQAHFLEYWGDGRAADGTVSIIQPLIQPLFGGHSEFELLGLLVDGRDRRGYDLVRETWQSILGGVDFGDRWRRVLHDGLLAGSDLPPVVVQVDPGRLASLFANHPPASAASSGRELELCFQVSPNMYDGRYANNGWLQELPHPATKLTWDNAAVINVATARVLDVSEGDMIGLSAGQKTFELPILILPGVADNTIVVDFGYGRTAAGGVGTGVGVNAFRVRPVQDAYYTSPVTISKTDGNRRLGSTQNHWGMEGRPIVREADLAAYRADPDFAGKMAEHPPLESMYPDYDYSHGYQWGMVIDLTACIGCNACTIACQSENNIPVVGREQVIRNREMHWLRLDRYFTGSPDNPGMVHQPVACQHCENAPCEGVCPVAATVHDKEGLNVMAYNRCVGTRYCSNNCPYKVRRFNFFNYTKDTPEVVKMAHNPDVTVRSRGVMEKCTFCIQRLNRAKMAAKKQNQAVSDGEVMTACQQACPTGAIVFGNINDPDSRVAKAKRNRRNYALLGELNIRPRNSYLAKIHNPHPDLSGREPWKDV